MIITKEQQEAILNKYMKDHNASECIGFMDGINATIELMQKISKNQTICH